MNRWVLWGSAGHSKVLADAIALRGGRVVAIFDKVNVPSSLLGVQLFLGVEGFHHWADECFSIADVVGLVAIGGARGRDRLAVQELFRQRGVRIGTLIHPQASVSASATVGAGTQVLAQSVIAAEARLGEACIINHRASVDHECVLGNGVHVAPGVTLCGCVTLGDNVFVGAGAVVLPRLSVGTNSIIGAGAVVTRNVPRDVTVVGNPSRQITDKLDKIEGNRQA